MSKKCLGSWKSSTFLTARLRLRGLRNGLFAVVPVLDWSFCSTPWKKLLMIKTYHAVTVQRLLWATIFAPNAPAQVLQDLALNLFRALLNFGLILEFWKLLIYIKAIIFRPDFCSRQISGAFFLLIFKNNLLFSRYRWSLHSGHLFGFVHLKIEKMALFWVQKWALICARSQCSSIS